MKPYNFKNKSIKCDTWEQMLHLTVLAEEQGYQKDGFFNRMFFDKGSQYFHVDTTHKYSNYPNSDGKEITHYTNFINPHETESFVVTDCTNCPFYERDYKWEQFCRYPDKGRQMSMSENMFASCPLKTYTITIKLNQDDSAETYT